MKKIRFFSFFCLAQLGMLFQLSAQTNILATYRLAGAANGLNLRTEGHANAKIISTIPFMERVSVISEGKNEVDTLGTLFFDSYEVGKQYKDYLIGSWVKVKYRDLTGYVFDAYLVYNYQETKTELYNNFGILYVGVNCFDNIHPNKELNWKGLFRNGEQFEIKDVDLNYYNNRWELGGQGITTNDNSNLLFVLGSAENTFQEGSVNGEYFGRGMNKFFHYKSEEKEYINKIEGFSVKYEEEKLSLYLLNNDNGKEYLISPSNGSWPNCLNWIGDLDGDGIEDYIITFGEKGSGSFLYLSSQAKEDEIVRPVAVYSSGYCC